MADRIVGTGTGSGQSIYQDGQGRQYILAPDGSKVYSQPIGKDAAGNWTYDPSKVTNTSTIATGSGSFLHNPPQFNTKTGEMQSGGWDWGWLTPLIEGAGFATGLGALGAFGGAGTATGAIPTSTMGDLASVGAIGSEVAPGALASTTIGTGALGPIAGGTGSGSGMGFLDTVKNLYNAYQKGSQVYDAAKELANPGNAMTPAGQIGQTAGSIEQQRLSALIAEIQAQQRQDQLTQSRARLALAAPGAEAQNSVQGDILANGQDATISGLPKGVTVPNIGGGLRPSMLSANSRSLGANMSRNALLNNLSGKDVPDLTPLPSSNAFDKILQGTAIGGGFLNAANGLFKRFTHGTGEISGFLPNNTGAPTDGTMPYPKTPPELMDPNDPNNPNYILYGYGG